MSEPDDVTDRNDVDHEPRCPVCDERLQIVARRVQDCSDHWCMDCRAYPGHGCECVRREETKADRLAYYESIGAIDPTCLTCRREVYESEQGLIPFGPRHQASERCESGKHPHCTCDTCF